MSKSFLKRVIIITTINTKKKCINELYYYKMHYIKLTSLSLYPFHNMYTCLYSLYDRYYLYRRL